MLRPEYEDRYGDTRKYHLLGTGYPIAPFTYLTFYTRPVSKKRVGQAEANTPPIGDELRSTFVEKYPTRHRKTLPRG